MAKTSPTAETVPVRHHDGQGVAFGKAPEGVACGDDHALYFIRSQMFARSLGIG